MTDKLSNLLREYFEPEKRSRSDQIIGLSIKPPLSPACFDWEVHQDPERFSKRFKFDSRHRMTSFLNELMIYEDEVGHHGEQRINYDQIDISVYTHDVNRITELDKEYARDVDNIYRDVLDFDYG